MNHLALLITAACTVSLVFALPSQAADPANGQKLARPCAVCHGKLGIGKDPLVPHIAGQPAQYLEKSLTEYKTGKRKDPRMTLMAKSLSADQIKDLAAWFASIKIEVQAPTN